MAQAKGVLPIRDDREVLWKNPHASGYFVGVRLSRALSRQQAEAWFRRISDAIERLVERETEDGPRMAAVAIGVGRSFFLQDGAPRFNPPIEPPAGLATGVPLPHEGSPLAGGAAVHPADVMFYVVTAAEARLARFVDDLWATKPDIDGIDLERGYQRIGEREPFGYIDGVRNVAYGRRSRVVFVDRDDRHLEEPEWADGGSYMAYMKILQHPDRFVAVGAPDAQDALVGRTREGERLDRIGQGRDPKDEASDPPPAIPPSSHVFKTGPRGTHDDVEIFRRGMPFLEVAGEAVRVGLHFCSFQASLEQLDVMLNDWMGNVGFPASGAGVDALLNPQNQLVTFERVGYFFVVPREGTYHGEALFRPPPRPRRPKRGKLVIRKRVVSDADPTARLDRRGFRFRVLDASGVQIGHELVTDSTGRAVLADWLTVGQSYTIEEIAAPPGLNVTLLPPQAITIERARTVVPLQNRVSTVPPSWG